MLVLSVEYYGDVASDESDLGLTKAKRLMKLRGGGFGIPVRMLSLRERAKQANFAQCDKCFAAKEQLLQYR
eukprot:2437612-Pleurochrysis_carterae.AAC.1